MDILHSVILIVHILAGVGVVALVLLQHGKGADMGAAFGSGASGSLFGATGSANFLSRATAVLAAVFFLTSLGLVLCVQRTSDTGDQCDGFGSGSRSCSGFAAGRPGGSGFKG
jgi:protein translocase SecG subunit